MGEMGEKWEVEYSRFFNFPPLSRSSTISLARLTDSTRGRIRGTWLSSGPSGISAKLFLTPHLNGFVLSVSFFGKIHEEHYISKLNFTWPHVSCMSGYPARGSRSVFVSYKDRKGEIQKFALRFSSACDIEAFMATLKELLQAPKVLGNKSNDKPVSGISSQSDYIPSEEVAYRPIEDWSTAITTYQSIDQLESSFNSEVAQNLFFPQTTVLNHDMQNPISSQYSARNHDLQNPISPQTSLLNHDLQNPISLQTSVLNHVANNSVFPQTTVRNHVANNSVFPQTTVRNHDVGNTMGGYPPSFMSMMMMSSQPNVEEAMPSLSEQADLRLQLMRYLDASSFQDIMGKVEEVMSEIGNDMFM